MKLQKTSQSVIKAEELQIGYTHKKQQTLIAKDLNFSIKAGELVAVVGTNGIGKSTLLRTLAKVQSPLAGQVYIQDKPLEQFTSIELAKALSVVLTGGIPTKNLSVLEVIALGRQPYTNWVGRLSAQDIAHVKQILRQSDLENIQYKKCYQLSDGQFQRVMIARALAQDTELIILDEPTTHLDIYHKAKVLKMLQTIVTKAQKAIVFSTHEIDLALQLCDKILILQKEGSVFGTPAQLIEKGSFSSIFPKDLICFDPESKRFKIT